MKRLICKLRGHDTVPVTRIGLAATGVMLPSLDGSVAYKYDPNGTHRACRRCRTVLDG